MKAIELSGIHIGKTILIRWRRPSWPKSREDAAAQLYISVVLHKANGDVVLVLGSTACYPFDAEIEFLD
jgi:hypothetical protein